MRGITRRKTAPTFISIDGAGRVAVPKALRNSLHLRPGEPLIAERRDDAIGRKEQAPGLVKDDPTGLLVYDGGIPPGSEDVVGLIDRDRDRRSGFHLLLKTSANALRPIVPPQSSSPYKTQSHPAPAHA